jgi:capsular exopolysaccharide synthesis family protein
LKAAQDNLARLEGKLATLRARYTAAHPLLQNAEEEVAAERARVAQLVRGLPSRTPSADGRPDPVGLLLGTERFELQRQLAALESEQAGLRARTDNLRNQADKLRKSLRTLSQEELELTNLRRTVEASRNLANVLSDKLMGARMREQGESTIVRIIDPASYPAQPTSSKTQKLFIMMLAVAGGLAFGAAFGVEVWKQPIETESDVEKAVELPVLGSIGVLSRTEPGQKDDRRDTAPIVLREGWTDSHGEAYRSIRTNIEADRLEGSFQSILVTSAGPGEGKSTTLLNLAHAFVEFGRRVLVIDGDLRRPSLHRALRIQPKRGFAHFLSGLASFEEVAHYLPSGLTVILGKMNGDEILPQVDFDRLRRCLFDLGDRFDVVLMDSAPVLAVSDSLVMAASLDRVLVVARASRTSRRDLSRTKKALNRVGARILGVVLNQADARDVHYYHPKYQKYYASSKRGKNKSAVGSRQSAANGERPAAEKTAGSRQSAVGSGRETERNSIGPENGQTKLRANSVESSESEITREKTL